MTVKNQVTKCINDTCLVLSLGFAKDLQIVSLGSYRVAHTPNNHHIRNKKKTKIKEHNKHTKNCMIMQGLGRFCRYRNFDIKIS
jgi:hypothetical protein